MAGLSETLKIVIAADAKGATTGLKAVGAEAQALAGHTAGAKNALAGLGASGGTAGRLLKSAFAAVRGDTAAAAAGIRSVGSAAQQTTTGASGLSGSLKNLGREGSTTGTILKGALAGGILAVGAGIAAMAFQGVQKFVDLTAQVRAFQRVAGTTAEDSSKLVFAMRQLGIDSDTAAKGAFQLEKRIASGTQHLQEYGIQIVRDKDGNLNYAATLANVAEGYQHLTDSGEKNRLLFLNFGKAGTAMIPILSKSKAEIQALYKEAGKDHQIFSQKELNQGRIYALQIKLAKESVTGLEIELGKGLIPVLTQVAKTGTNAFHFLDSVAGKSGGFFDAIGQAAKPLLGVPDAISKVFGGGKLFGGGTEETGKAEAATRRLLAAHKELDKAFQSGDKSRITQATKEYTAAQDDATRADDQMAVAEGEETSTAKAQAKQKQEDEKAFTDAAKAIDDYAGRTKSLQDSLFSVADAQDAVGESLKKVDYTIKTGSSSVSDRRKAFEDLVKASTDLADAQVGPLATAQQKTDAEYFSQIVTLEKLKNQYPKLTGEIQPYIDRLNLLHNAGGQANLDATQAIGVLNNLKAQYPELAKEIDALIPRIQAQASATGGMKGVSVDAIGVLNNLKVQYPLLGKEIDALIGHIQNYNATQIGPKSADISVDQALANLNALSNKLVYIGDLSRNVLGPGGNRPLANAASGASARRSKGGPVQAGKSYLVGEERSELFIPSNATNTADALRDYEKNGSRYGDKARILGKQGPEMFTPKARGYIHPDAKGLAGYLLGPLRQQRDAIYYRRILAGQAAEHARRTGSNSGPLAKYFADLVDDKDVIAQYQRDDVLLKRYAQLASVLEGRAVGGPVKAGKGYVVGEKGPEYFVPKESGYIVPNAGQGRAVATGRGGGTTNVTVEFHTPAVMDSMNFPIVLRQALQQLQRDGYMN